MQQNFPNSLWESGSNIFFRDPEVRYCALVFQDVDNCSSVLVFQVTRMGTKSHLQGEGCRDSNPFFPKHPHTVSPPSTHTGARAHLYSHVQIWTLQAHNCPWQALRGQLGKEREQATRGKDLSLLPFPPLPLLSLLFASLGPPQPHPCPSSILHSVLSPLPLLTPPAPLAPSLPEQRVEETPQLLLFQPQQPPRTVRVIITPPTPGAEAEVTHWPGDEGVGQRGVAGRGAGGVRRTQKQLPRGGQDSTAPLRWRGLWVTDWTAAPETLSSRQFGGVRWLLSCRDLGGISWWGQTPPPEQPELRKPEIPEEREPKRRKGVQGAQLLRVPLGAGGNLSHGSK